MEKVGAKKLKKLWLVGKRIYLDVDSKSFVFEKGAPYRLYADELSQMFVIALRYGMLDLRIVGNQSDEAWEGKFNLKLADEKQFKTWFEEE